MDPNEALATLRRISQAATSDTETVTPDDLVYMAEVFQGLDEWLKKGGFLPSSWNRAEKKFPGFGGSRRGMRIG